MAKARQQYFADEASIAKDSREFAITPELLEKINSIEPGAQVNVIETVKVNGEALEPDDDKAVDVSVPLVEDTLYSTDTTAALSAKQGKVLYEYIQNISSRGRYLSNWNCVTGLAMTNPVDNPYNYMAGDYYVISVVASQGGTNYRPNGSQYITGLASTTVETEIVKPGDYYTYDGTNWLLLINTAREIAVDSELSASSTNPVENRVVTGALNTKQNVITDLSTIRSGAAAGATALQPGDSLSQLTGDSDDITEGSTHLFMTTSERTKLSNQSGVNTGDETQATIMSKLGAASSSTNGYLTSTDWNTFNGKQDAISDLSTIRDNATAGASAASTIATYGDIVTHDANEFASASSGALADTAVQPGDNISVLTNDAGYITNAYHDSTKQDTLVAGNNIQIAADGKTISANDTTYVAGDFDIKDLADSTGLRTEWSGKQDELIAGANIQIAADGKTISATDTTYSAGPGISISNNNVISAIDSKAVWGSIEGTLSDQTDLQDALDAKQGTLTAGTNIQIAQDGTISATDTTYTAGTGISIDANNVISNTQTSAEWGNISGTLSNQTDLQSALDNKQNTLTAGANIQIAQDGTISATDTKYTASDFDIKDLADSTGKRASWDAKQNAISDLATIRSNASTAIQPNDNVSELTNDAGYITSADIPTLDTAMSATSTNGVQNKVIKSYVDTQVQEATSGAVSDAAYDSSWNGITGIAPSKNAVYDKISAMDTTISGKQDTISDLSTIRSGASKGATAVQPGDNISTLNNDAGFITKAVSDLTNYYTKSEVYTKTEVDNKIANFAGFKVVATLPTTDIKTNIIYLLGPVGTGADRYEEYIYSNNTWIKIGETTVDLSPYFNKNTDTSDAITQGSTNLFLTSAERTKLSNTSGTNTGDETKTTIQTKLGAASASNDGYLTSADWSTFNGKVNTSDVLTKTNTTSYTPTANYHPATKKYVDDGLAGKQASLTAGENIEINSNVISANNLFIITESDVTVSTTDEYGVAPYNTSYYYTNIDINANAGIKWVEGAIYTFVVNTTMVVASTNRNVRVKIGNGTYIPVMGTTTSLAGHSYFTKANTRQYQYTTKYEAGGALHLFSDSNTTYSAMSVSEGKTGTATTARTVRADYLKQVIKYHSVDDTAYASSWNGATDIAPSKNAVYDKISAMDTTIGNKANTSDVVLKNSDATQLITATNSSVTVDTPLSLKSNTSTSYIALNGSSGFLGSYGVTSDKKPTFYNGSSHQLAYTTDIPTVNNGTLTITQNGTSKGTFTANQSGASTIALTDTTYESKAAASGGTAVSLVTTGEKYTWNNKIDSSALPSAMTASELNTGTSTTGRTISAALLKAGITGAINARIDTKDYSSSWDGSTNAPTENAVYDKISAMDTTIGNKANTSDVLTKTNTTSYTPTANYHPATKKYVDDAISQSSGGIQTLPGSPIEIKYIWAGTQEQYEALSTYREDTIYHIV